jgi:hypothetical protein
VSLASAPQGPSPVLEGLQRLPLPNFVLPASI